MQQTTSGIILLIIHFIQDLKQKNQTVCSHGITNIISKIKIIYMKINKINLFKTKNMANDRYY